MFRPDPRLGGAASSPLFGYHAAKRPTQFSALVPYRGRLRKHLSGGMMFRKLAVTLAATLFSISASYAGEWVRLGDRNVGFINDRDVIHVGRHDGKFKRLKLIVRRNDIKLNSIKV